MKLVDCLGLNAMHIDKKLLALVGDSTVVPFHEVHNFNDSLKHKIVLGNKISQSETFRAVDELGMDSLVQQQHDHFIYNLLMAAIIGRFPDTFLKNPLPTIIRSSADSEFPALNLDFAHSDQKNQVMRETEAFIESNPRLSSLSGNLLLIANELMMNALYCAPQDEDGEPIFLNKDRSQPAYYRNGLAAQLTLAYNKDLAVIGCRDPFGSVSKERVTKRLHEVFKADQKAQVRDVQNPKGGSGLGLKMIIETSTGFGMVVRNRVETFVYATLPLGRGNKAIEQMAKNLCLNFYG